MGACLRKAVWIGALLSAQATLAEEPPAAPAGAAAKAEAPPPSTVRSNEYVSEWNSLPTSQIPSLERNQSLEIKPSRGEATVMIFLASWCDTCQDLIQDFKRLERKYSDVYVRFFFVFSHDTRDDALGFYREYHMRAPAGLANHDILRQYKNPPLPTIYVADKNSWLTSRYENVTPENLRDLDRYLASIVSF